jgi:hypothetical protein
MWTWLAKLFGKRRSEAELRETSEMRAKAFLERLRQDELALTAQRQQGNQSHASVRGLPRRAHSQPNLGAIRNPRPSTHSSSYRRRGELGQYGGQEPGGFVALNASSQEASRIASGGGGDFAGAGGGGSWDESTSSASSGSSDSSSSSSDSGSSGGGGTD